MNWKLDYIENINIDKKKFSYGSNIFAYKRKKYVKLFLLFLLNLVMVF